MLRMKWWCAIAVLGLATAHAAEPAGVRLLAASPACVKERLGQIAVSLGTRDRKAARRAATDLSAPMHIPAGADAEQWAAEAR